MTRSRKSILQVITFLPLIVMISASLVFLKQQADILIKNANLILAEQLQLRFHRAVTVGELRIKPIGRAVIKDIVVANGETFEQGKLISVGRVVVRYDWRELILRGRGADSVGVVEVIDPELLLIRQPDGTLNITELLKPPPGPKKPPFRGLVKVIGGKATFIDYAIRPGETPRPTNLHNVDAVIRASSLPVYRFTGTTRGAQGQFLKAAFDGTYNTDSKHASIKVDAEDTSAALLTLYAWKSKDAQVFAGKIDVDATITVRHTSGHYKTSISGKGVVKNAAARISMLRDPITGANGLVEIEDDVATIGLKGNYAGALVNAAGSLSFAKQPIVVNATIDSSAIDTRRLINSVTFLSALKQLSPSGLGKVHVKITGAFSDPIVTTDAYVPGAAIQGIPLSKIAVSSTYQNGIVTLKQTSLSVKGASVQLSGSVHTRRGAVLELQGRFANLDLALMPINDEFAAKGIADGAFTISGPASEPNVSLTTRASNGSIAGVPFGSVEGGVQISGAQARISNLVVSGVFGGLLRADGVISTSGALDVTASGESIDLKKLADRLDKPGYSGTSFFCGRISGSLTSPQIEGSVEAFNVKALDYTIDHAFAVLNMDRDRVVVSEAAVQVFPAEVRISGQATGLQTDQIFMAANASLRRADITRLLEMADRQVDVIGIINGDFAFSGIYRPWASDGDRKLTDAVASGSLQVTDGTAFGYPISTASMGLDYSDDVLSLLDASITGDGAGLIANGEINVVTRAVDGTFNLTGFALSRLQEAVGDYVILSGVASASGMVEGDWKNIRTATDVDIDGLVLNYEKFDRANVDFVYQDGKIASCSTVLERASQSMQLSATDFDTKTKCLASAKGEFANISIPDVLRIARASPYFSSPEAVAARAFDKIPKINGGRVNGAIELNGCFGHSDSKIPNGRIDLAATDVGIDIQQVQSVELHASARDGVVRLEQFLAISDDASLMAFGERAYEQGILEVEIAAENVQLSRLKAWMGSNAPEGTLSALFNIDGSILAPDIIGSVEVIKPGYGGFTFDSLRAGQIRVGPGRIEVPDVLLSAQGHQAAATASVPWDWLSMSVPKDEPIMAWAQLDQQSLSIMSVMLPVVDGAGTTGTLDAAWFQLGGTLLDPQLSGSLKISEGNVAINGFTNTFSGVEADLGFDEDRIVVNRLTASSSEGGRLYVVPDGYIALGIMGASEINLAVVADQLKVGEKNLFGLKEDVVTQIDAGLLVSGSLFEPTITDIQGADRAGGITVSNAKLAFQTGTAREQSSVAAKINPKLDISLNVGPDVVIAPPSMRLSVIGAGKLVGTLLEPVVPGIKLNVLSGNINLATARLRILGGGTINLAYSPPHPPSVSVNLQAAASVLAINNLRRQERYQITMQVTGQATDPRITLASNPPGLSREQMLAALGHVPGLFSSPESDLQNELSSVLTAAAATTLFAPIEDFFVQKFGFEQFSLHYSTSSPLSLYLSHRLVDKLYVSFYRRLSAALTGVQDVEYQVLLNYRINPNYQFSFGFDDQQTATFQIMYATAFR